MATDNVNVVYTADVQQYQTSLAEAMALTERYSTSADNLAGAIGKVGIAAARVTTGNPLSKQLSLQPATQAAAAYEQQLSLLGARAKVSGQDIGDLNRSVMQLSRSFPIGMGEAVKQFETIQRAGKAGDELNKITTSMVKLGAATGEMSTGLSQAQVQFARTFEKFDSKRIGALNDSVTTLSASFGSSASSMVDFGNAIAPISKQVGMASTDVLGFATAFSKAGEDGYRAANVFNKMIGDMERSVRTGSPQVRAYAEALDMTVEQFRSLANDKPTDVMVNFLEAIKTQGKDGIRILEDIGLDGVRAMRSITAVAGQGGIREAVDEARKAYGSGSTEEAAKEAFGGLADSMNKTRESLNQLVAAGGQPYLKMMSGVTESTNSVINKMTEWAQSPLVQTLITGGVIAGGLGKVGATVGTGLFVGNAAKSGVATGAFQGARQQFAQSSVGQWVGQNRQLVRAGAVGGLALGAASGNQAVQVASMAALVIPGLMSSGKLGDFVRAAGRAVTEGSFGLTRESAATWKDAARGRTASRRGWFYRLDRQADALSAGGIRQAWRSVVRGEANPYMPTNVGTYARPEYPASSIDDAFDAIAEKQKRINQTGTAGQKVRYTAGRIATAPARGFASLGAWGMTGLGFLGTPVGMVAGGLAAGGAAAYGGYKMASSTGQGLELPSQLEMFAENTGLAAKEMAKLTQQLEALGSSATSTADAMRVTALERRAIGNPEYEAAFKVSSKETDTDVARMLRVMGINQSAEFQNRLVMDVASQRGPGSAEDIARAAFAANGPTPLEAAIQLRNSEINRNPINQLGNQLFGKFFGQQETMGYISSAAQNERARIEELDQAQGQSAAVAYASDVAKDINEQLAGMEGRSLFDVPARNLKYVTVDKSEAKALYGALPIDNKLVDEQLEYLYGDWNTRGRVKSGMSDEQRMEIYENSPIAEFYREQEKLVADAQGGELEGYISGTLATGGFTGRQDLSRAFGKAAGAGQTPKEALDAYIEARIAVDRGAAAGGPMGADFQSLSEQEREEYYRGQEYFTSPGALTLGEAQQAQAYLEPENAAAQGAANIESLTRMIDLLSQGASGATNAISQLVGSFQGLRGQRLATGEVSPELVATASRDFEQFQAAIQLRTGGSMSQGEARRLNVDTAEALLATVPQDDQGNYIWSPGETGQNEQAWYMAVQQGQEDEQRIRRNMVRQNMNRQIQFNYQQEDFTRQSGYARQDQQRGIDRARASFERQQGYAREDIGISQARAREDYHRSETRAWADFYKQRTRQMEDFNRQRRNMMEDYNKSIARSQEDFALSMERAADQMARAMLSPFERIGASRVWSSGGLAANLEEQNRAVAKQLEVLESLRDRGLSQDTIDLLGLGNAQNARQTISLGRMTEEEIAALNQATGTRMSLGGDMFEEQVGTRQQREDYAKQLRRQAEDLATSLRRQDEELALGRRRQMDDFVLSMQRNREDFNRQLSRQWADFNRSAQRQIAEMNIQFTQQREDLDRQISRQWDSILLADARAKDAIKLSNSELVFEGEDLVEAAKGIAEGQTIEYDQFLKSTLDGSITHLETTTTGSMTTVTGVMTDSTGEIVKVTTEAQTGITEMGGTIDDAMDSAKTKALAAGQAVENATTQMIDNMKTEANRAQNIMRLFGQAMSKLLVEQTKDTEKKIREGMGDFAWMLEADNGTVSKNKKEIVIKVDQASFDSTFGSVDWSTGGTSKGGGVPATYTGSSSDLFATGGEGGITQAYGRRNASYAAGYHTGLDIGAPAGTPIYSTIDGKVVSSGYDKAYGNNVVVDDDDSGVRVLYGHMLQRLVKSGDSVDRGSLIGKVGSTGFSSGNHLHVEARVKPWKYGNDINPANYLYNGGVAMRPGYAMVAERSPEAIIPLDGKGAKFLADVMELYSGAHGARRSRVAGYSISHTTNVTSNHYDSSVHADTITVQANDPDALYEGVRRKMARNRLASRV